jgi:hypothetical protein
MRYDGDIMMSRTQIVLDPELQRRARKRAAELGISFAEYVRGLVARDLGARDKKTDPSSIFDLGDSGGSDVARDKDRMIGEAIATRKLQRRRGSR